MSVEALAEGFGTAGVVAAFYLFLSPLPTAKTICKKKSSLHFSSLPYLSQLLESGLWLIYALMQGPDKVHIAVNNGLGCFFMLLCLSLFLLFPSSPDATFTRPRTAAALLGICVVLGATVGYSAAMDFTCVGGGASGVCSHVGVAAVVLNIVKYTSPLGVLRRVVQTKSVEFMPLNLTLACLACSICWGVYGLLKNDLYTIIANVAGFFLALVQIALYMRYMQHPCRPKLPVKPVDPLSTDDHAPALAAEPVALAVSVSSGTPAERLLDTTSVHV